MTNLHERACWSGRRFHNPVHLRRRERPSLERTARTAHDLALVGSDGNDVPRRNRRRSGCRARRQVETLSLADREPMDAIVIADYLAVFIDNPACYASRYGRCDLLLDERLVVVIGDEADLLTVRL